MSLSESVVEGYRNWIFSRGRQNGKRRLLNEVSYVIYDEVKQLSMNEDLHWLKDTHSLEWVLCRKSNNARKGSFDYSALVPWSVDKIEAIINQFGSAPAGLIDEMPLEVLAQLTDKMLDAMC